jgi:DNA repair exonuclease SbcCD nuclease subunit
LIIIKILWWTDLHINNTIHNLNNPNFQESLNILNFIKQIIVDEKIDITINGGDLFEDSKSISSKVLSVVSHLISEMGLLCPQIFLLGNHDTPDKIKMMIDTDNPNLNIRSSTIYPFNMFDGISVIDECKVIVNDEEKILMFFVPYILDPLKNIKELVKKYQMYEDYKKVLFGHIDINDLNYISINKESVTNKLGVLPSVKDLLDTLNFQLVILGHIHEKMEFTHDNNKLIYTGSIRNQNFNNTTKDKGMYIIDTDDLSMKYINNPYTYYYIKINNVKELKEYINNNSKEMLSKTNLMFYYKDNKDIENINKLRSLFHELRLREIPKNIENIQDEHEEKIKNLEKSFEYIDLTNILSFIKEYSNIDTENEEYDKIFNKIKNYNNE